MTGVLVREGGIGTQGERPVMTEAEPGATPPGPRKVGEGPGRAAEGAEHCHRLDFGLQVSRAETTRFC